MNASVEHGAKNADINVESDDARGSFQIDGSMMKLRPSSSELKIVVERILMEGLGHQISVDALQLLDDKIGQRCVAVARLDTQGGSDQQPQMVYVKWFADAERGRNTYNDLRLIGNSLAPGTDVRVPQTLGMTVEPCVVVLDEVPGVPLTRLSEDQLIHAAPHIGRAIAHLQQCGAELSRRYVLDDELETVKKWSLEIVASGAPGSIVEQFDGIAEKLRSFVAITTQHPDEQVVIHRDLHHEHVFVSFELESISIGIVDFDEVRIGDPFVDLAHLAVHLRLNDPSSFGTHRGGSVLSGAVFDAITLAWSIDSGLVIDPARLEFYGGMACLKVARQRAVGFGTQPRPTGNTRWRAVERSLELADALLVEH